MSTLRHDLVKDFNEEDLRSLCFDLGVNYDALPGSGTEAKTRELIVSLYKAKRLPDLLKQLHQQRPNTLWSADETELAAITAEADAEAARQVITVGEVKTDSGDVVIGGGTINKGLGKGAVIAIIGAVAVLVLGGTAFTVRTLTPEPTATLSPTTVPTITPTPHMKEKYFNIAIAQFTVKGNADPSNGLDVANKIFDRVYRVITDTAELQGNVTMWQPDQTNVVAGDSTEVRARAAEQRAKAINAHVLVYGVLDTRTEPWQVSPEFYVNQEFFTRTTELVGQNELGVPVALSSSNGGNVGINVKANNKLAARVEALANMILGLSYYFTRDFDGALASFQKAAAVKDWGDEPNQPEGKHVVYHFIGVAALALKQYDTAYQAMTQSVQLNPEYARAYIGLGGLYRLRALQATTATGRTDFQNLDFDLLNQSIAYYQKASTAKDKSVQADIDPKVNFGLAEDYFLLAQGRRAPSYDAAAEHYLAVIEAYGNGANPRIRELVAESHARLGTIYRIFRRYPEAAHEYEQAVALFSTKGDSVLYDPTRAPLFDKRAKEMWAAATTSPTPLPTPLPLATTLVSTTPQPIATATPTPSP